MAAPEYRPRLWTSRSAGPDGILAETLRWCGPTEPEARLNYRQHVCEALIAVFNKILESGEVPPCPQFSKSRMSALYKGKGNREDPDKYRPICVGSSLGKIFGLILTARISHWVNTNSLISPAQIGFTPYMGCEHHIFTVLEILRDRARRRLDSCVVFVDFKKAYDNVDQNMAWTLLQKMGMPDQLVSLLRSWAETTEITLEMQGHKGASFRQLRGFLQGANLSPVLFTLVMEPLLRYVNSRSAELGVKIEDSPQPKRRRSSLSTTPDVPPPEIIHPPGRPPPLTPTWILALAYADDVILICPSKHQAQEAAQMVAKWADKFGFTIGLGEGKTEAMFISSQNVWEATKSLHRGATSPTETDDPTSTASSDDEREQEPQPLLKGQKRVNGKIVGSHTPRAAPFAPSPLPRLPNLEPIYLDDDKSPDKQIKWTLTYKYLGFIIRCDLSDDHAFQRAETKMRTATNRLFPRHRLIRRFPLSLKLQLFNSLVTSCAIQALPQMSSLSTPSDPRVKRLDALVQKSVREIIRLSHSTVRSYIAAEALSVDAMSLLTMHRLRFKESLKLHPYCDQLPEQQPYAIRVMDRMVRVADTIAIRPGRATEATVTAWVPTELQPWIMSTNKILQPLLQRADQLAIPLPTIAWRVAPYASIIARIAAQETWTRSSMKNIEHANHCFAVRPPSNSRRHVAAIHFITRLTGAEGGKIAKRSPLSCRAPGGCGSIAALCSLPSGKTSLVTKARLGNRSMHHYPFAPLDSILNMKQKQNDIDDTDSESDNDAHSVNSNAESEASDTIKQHRSKKRKLARSYTIYNGKTCMLCNSGEGYDLWHVLFECPQTCLLPAVQSVKAGCAKMLKHLCKLSLRADSTNKVAMNKISDTGHISTIPTAVAAVQEAIAGYQWDCLPGRWLQYLLILAMPYSERVVKPTDDGLSWTHAQLIKRRQNKRQKLGQIEIVRPDRTPVEAPHLAEAQYHLPELVGRLYDSILLPANALRPLANAWIHWSRRQILAVGEVVSPLRLAAERKRAPQLAVETASRISAWQARKATETKKTKSKSTAKRKHTRNSKAKSSTKQTSKRQLD